jgi:ADP-dependent NAD(P)H-hydrate dehydratase / NAD(P)H-hydrate epimerase
MGRPILTADQMRAAEQAAIDGGTSVETLMERAGAALAEAVWLYAGKQPVLLLCGPGNNGGDGRVAARHLRERGIDVAVAELAHIDQAEPRPVLVDCLFGTGLKRPLEEAVSRQLRALAGQARAVIACDLPSGADSDAGALLSPVPDYDMTVTFGALKPSHRLMPAMAKMGRVVLADIGVHTASTIWNEIGEPRLPPLSASDHKYKRGLVHCLAGTMPGAIALSARAAAKAGAGYVRISTSKPIAELPDSIVQTGTADMADERIGCIVVGPGLGDIPPVLTLALTSRAPKLIDADAIGLVGEPERLKGHDVILTPHEGEFTKLFGQLEGSKAERALAAAKSCGNVVVYKGPDTLVASPDGRLGFAPPAPAWLASAGTGDVLAGIIAAFRARGMTSFEAACAGVWVHGRAAEEAGPAMIADDLVEAVPAVLERL